MSYPLKRSPAKRPPAKRPLAKCPGFTSFPRNLRLHCYIIIVKVRGYLQPSPGYYFCVSQSLASNHPLILVTSSNFKFSC